jgi:TRAP-type transport system periplasmic protein
MMIGYDFKKKFSTALFLTFLFTGFAEAKTVVKFGTVAPDGTPWAESLKEIQARVKKESEEKIEIRTYLGGQLGGEIEILQGIRRGRIEGGGITSGALASVVPEIDVLEIPFLFESSEEADFILDHYLLEPFKKLFEEKGLILVTWAENGWRDIALKDSQVRAPEDLKGVRIRSQESQTHLEFWKKLGANPNALSIPEVLTSLQTGMVDGFDNTPLFTLAAQWHTAIQNYSVTKHIYQPAAIVYSKRFWDKQDDESKKILMGPGNSLAPQARAGVRALEEELIGVLRELKINVYELSNDERAAFKKAVAGLDRELIQKMGKKSQEIFELIQTGKEEFKKQKSKSKK